MTILNLLYRLLAEHWGCVSSFGLSGVLVGYFTGTFVTRKIMAPGLCPSCIKRNRWVEEFRAKTEEKTPEEKAESRRFYWLRRKKKDHGEKLDGDNRDN